MNIGTVDIISFYQLKNTYLPQIIILSTKPKYNMNLNYVIIVSNYM